MTSLLMHDIVIKQKPHWICWIPMVGHTTAQGVCNIIYLPPTLFKAYKYNILTMHQKGVIAHETHHCARQQEIGCIRWLLQYCIDKTFRLEEELSADAAYIACVCRNYGIEDKTKWIHKRALSLSSALYGWMVTYATAHTRLCTLWDYVEIHQQPTNVKKLRKES